MFSSSLSALTRAVVNKAGTKHLFNNLERWNPTVMMAASNHTESLVVEHDAKKNKFFIKLGDVEAKLEYVRQMSIGGEVLDMWHTEVPPKLQGKGIAKLLAKAAFDYVVDNQLKMQLSCTYLQKYYADNPLDKYKLAIFEV